MCALNIARTEHIRVVSCSETALAYIVERRMRPELFRPAFCAAVLRKWRSDAVRNVLRARDVDNAIARQTQTEAEFEARRRADIEKIGLWE